MNRLSSFLAACGGFLLLFLVTDLKYDLLLLTRGEDSATVAAIVSYYQVLFHVGLPPVYLPVGIACVVFGSIYKAYVAPCLKSFVLCGGMVASVAVAGFRTSQNGMALSAPGVSDSEAVTLARGLLFDHAVFALLMLAFIVFQIRDITPLSPRVVVKKRD